MVDKSLFIPRVVIWFHRRVIKMVGLNKEKWKCMKSKFSILDGEKRWKERWKLQRKRNPKKNGKLIAVATIFFQIQCEKWLVVCKEWPIGYWIALLEIEHKAIRQKKKILCILNTNVILVYKVEEILAKKKKKEGKNCLFN